MVICRQISFFVAVNFRFVENPFAPCFQTLKSLLLHPPIQKLSAALLFWFSHSLEAQIKKGEFVSQSILTANFCQVDGDQASGYNKIGYTLGYLIGQGLGKNWSYETGLMFSVRGSRRPFDVDNPSLPAMNLHYQMLDIPVYLAKDYQKFHFSAGIRTAYVISARDKENYIQNLDEITRKVNLLASLGLSYRYTSTLGFQLQGVYSIHSINRGGNPNPFIKTGSYHNNICLGLSIQLSKNEIPD